MAREFLQWGRFRFEIVSDGGAVTALRRTEETGRDEPDGVTRLCRAELTEYFAGTRKDFTFPVRPAGTAFRRAVWDSLERIPWGEARYYAQIAASVGRPSGARAAGQAIGENPVLIRIPCHRVLGKDGSLTGFGGGLDLKCALLTLEGIPFRE